MRLLLQQTRPLPRCRQRLQGAMLTPLRQSAIVLVWIRGPSCVPCPSHQRRPSRKSGDHHRYRRHRVSLGISSPCRARRSSWSAHASLILATFGLQFPRRCRSRSSLARPTDSFTLCLSLGCTTSNCNCSTRLPSFSDFNSSMVCSRSRGWLPTSGSRLSRNHVSFKGAPMVGKTVQTLGVRCQWNLVYPLHRRRNCQLWHLAHQVTTR
mmetsp:Transcript_32377/g.86836  ORF Transcript_32377/g.86836 Transcript_32377/m.86836 type:complete len:209 (-) Transcript_32377:438-1064(-)